MSQPDVDLDTVADILGGFVELEQPAVPAAFEQFVADRVAARPAPTREPGNPELKAINDKLDEILAILKEGHP